MRYQDHGICFVQNVVRREPLQTINVLIKKNLEKSRCRLSACLLGILMLYLSWKLTRTVIKASENSLAPKASCSLNVTSFGSFFAIYIHTRCLAAFSCALCTTNLYHAERFSFSSREGSLLNDLSLLNKVGIAQNVRINSKYCSKESFLWERNLFLAQVEKDSCWYCCK